MKPTLRSIAAALVVSVVSLGASHAQEIKISHQWKANVDGRDRAARLFVQEVNKQDPGIKFRIYPAQSLGMSQAGMQHDGTTLRETRQHDPVG